MNNNTDDDEYNDVFIYFKPSGQGGPLQNFNSSKKCFIEEEKKSARAQKRNKNITEQSCCFFFRFVSNLRVEIWRLKSK